jgi:hypothetical protein
MEYGYMHDAEEEKENIIQGLSKNILTSWTCPSEPG